MIISRVLKIVQTTRAILLLLHQATAIAMQQAAVGPHSTAPAAEQYLVTPPSPLVLK